MTSLSTPKQWVLKKMTVEECAEMIERHIDFVDKDGRSVHLPTQFVRHYMNRDDGALPICVAVSTLPLVFADGGVWATDKFDRLRGIDFRIEPQVSACVPQPDSITDDDVERAMTFLTEEWLVDVATDYAGKCTIVAAALTLIERCLLDQRPAFFVTAGRRGGGKTTTLTMLIKAVTGIWPAAAAWSTNEEERRKALLSYFHGVAYILWDNITRGTQISCPHIEKSCTAAYYSDRKLGVSEMVATAASTIHFFTGNNIGPRGDLASQSLEIRLKLDRYDPENRAFKHPDPIGWTDAMRAEILGAFYTILLGNPILKQPRNALMKTRFKMWWRLVGSAVEHAAMLANPDREVDFRKLFLSREDVDEDFMSLAEVLDVLEREKWPNPDPQNAKAFTAKGAALFVNAQGDPDAATVREFFYPAAPPTFMATPRSIAKRLKKHLDEPVKSGECTLILRTVRTGHKGDGLTYFIESRGAAEAPPAPPGKQEGNPGDGQAKGTAPPPETCAVIAAWRAQFLIGESVTIDRLIAEAGHTLALNAALLAVAPLGRDEAISNVLVARWLRKNEGGECDGYQIERDPDHRENAWRLTAVAARPG